MILNNPMIMKHSKCTVSTVHRPISLLIFNLLSSLKQHLTRIILLLFLSFVDVFDNTCAQLNNSTSQLRILFLSLQIIFDYACIIFLSILHLPFHSLPFLDYETRAEEIIYVCYPYPGGGGG